MKQKDLVELHKEAMLEFNRIQQAQYEIREECLKDRRLCSILGASYENDRGLQFANSPKLEFNKIYLACIRITNEYRNNRLEVKFSSKDDNAQDLADECAGMLRADEQECCAQEAYDNAFDEGLKGGMGAWKLSNTYVDDEDEDDDTQNVRIEPIFDADSSVFFDLGSERQDKADAKCCFVIKGIPKYQALEMGYESSIDKMVRSYGSWRWATKDMVYIAEYYKVYEKKELVRWYIPLTGRMEDEIKVTEAMIESEPDLLEQLKSKGYSEARQKRVKKKCVRKYILTGARVEEDCGEVPGGLIPVVPFFGNRQMIEGIEHIHGHGRMARDAQFIFNASMSWVMDIASRSPTSVPIFRNSQIAGHEKVWGQSNINKPPYLTINDDSDEIGTPAKASPIEYTKTPEVPAAMAAMIQTAAQTLDELLGSQQAGEQLQPNMSGKAVELIQNRLDMQTYIYMSNFAKAMQRSGEIWLAMKKAVCIEAGRKMKTVNEDGKPGYIEINKVGVSEDTGTDERQNDLIGARLDCLASVGPSTGSKRASVVRSVTGLMQMVQDPETQKVLTHLVIQNIEGEGMGGANEWSRKKMVDMGVAEPTDEDKKRIEAQQAQAQQPDAQAVFLAAESEKSLALTGKAKADTIKSLVEAEAKAHEMAMTMQQAMQQMQSMPAMPQFFGPQQQPDTEQTSRQNEQQMN